MEFINRETELAFLNNSYLKRNAQLVIIYGRRRVGKTALLLRFCQNKPHIYLLADLKPEKEQLRDFSIQMAKEMDDDMLRVQPLESVEAFFTYLEMIWQKKRIVVVIDEFPYLCRVNRAFSSILQKFWDMRFKTTKAFLALCGSSIGMMEKETLLQQSPLYGRRTGDWLLTSLKFKHFIKFFPEMNLEQAIILFSVVGGIPEYLMRIDKKKNTEQNVIEIIRKGGAFYKEVDFIIREELTEPHNYFAILNAIAFGKNKQNEIVNHTGLNKGIVSKYLSVLENLQLIKRIAPITENIERTRKSIYVICDNYFRFWFRFCFPHRSMLEEGKEEFLLKTEILPNLPQFVSQIFEDICRDAISEEFERVGSWWHKDNEIDVVGISGNKIIFCECKWTKEPLRMNDLQNLISKSRFTELTSKELFYGLFSKAGFTNDLKAYAKTSGNIRLYDLRALSRIFQN